MVQKSTKPLLNDIKPDSAPRTVIDTLSEDLLGRFADLPLMEPYDVYQRLMDYWENVMQTTCTSFLLTAG